MLTISGKFFDRFLVELTELYLFFDPNSLKSSFEKEMVILELSNFESILSKS